ncbi:MAG: hypothetical protein ACLRMJ_04775 [Alistipes finegoldii]
MSALSRAASESAQAIISSVLSAASSPAFIITAILSLIFRFENAAAAFRSPSGKNPVMFSLNRSRSAAEAIATTSTPSSA